MTQYIDKDALVAGIEKLKVDTLQKKSQCRRNGLERIMHQIVAYNKVISLINTFKVKEVDEEPACKIFPRPIECYSDCKECPWLATNNKAQKGE